MAESHHPPAFCTFHGFFPAASFNIGSGTKGLYLQHLAVDCPVCGRSSEILSGVYRSNEDILEILVDSSISPEALTAIKRITERLQRGEITVPEAKAEAEKISPKAGRLFDIADWSDEAKSRLYSAFLIAIGAIAVAGITRTALSPRQTVNVHPVIERVIQEKKPSAKDWLRSSSAYSTPVVPIPHRRPETAPPIPQRKPNRSR